MGKGEEVAVLTLYPALAVEPGKVAAIMRANVGTLESVFELDRIKIPTGGGAAFTVPTLDGEKTESKILGIIAQWQDVRAYWAGEFAGNEPPQCSSPDGETGYGDPGGLCRVCPFAQWRSGKHERGQACKAMRRLFLLRPEGFLPSVLTIPPTGLKEVRHYMMQLTNAQVPYWGAVTEIALKQQTNPEGIKYTVAIFRCAQILDEAARDRAAAFGKLLDPLMAQRGVAEDYAASEA